MTVINFTPNPNGAPPFQTTVTLDGNPYTLSVTWSLAGQRWYMSLTDPSGNVAWYGAMVGSPLTSNIYLALGVFETSTILWREDSGTIEISP